jgi:hypothetical protein
MKTKVLFRASISKIAFNINGLTMHSTLNIPIQQSLSSFPNLSLDSLNRLYMLIWTITICCDKWNITYGHVRMFIVTNNRLRSIKHIQSKFFDGVDVIMTCDFYQAPHAKDSWIFQNIKDNVNALTLNFWQTYVQCYELNKIMQ